MNCGKCGRLLYANQTKCPCGWKRDDVEIATPSAGCHFAADGRCRGKVTVRINDSWLCNWHWENGYDAQLRTGEIVQKFELKRQKRMKEINEYVEKYQSAHPSASKKDASFAYMREHGLLQTLAAAAPQLMQDHEALTEREAIQTEGA